MGLTIHWDLENTSKSTKNIKTVLSCIRNDCMDMAFEEVGNIVHFKGDECNYEKRDNEDEYRWFLIHCMKYITVKEENRDYNIKPLEVIGFSAWPGEGCESMDIFLCKYPKIFTLENGKKKRTRVKEWEGSSFCKTQYANNPKYGGTPHFLRCHLSVIKTLEVAKTLGILKNVDDEGNFWDKRDFNALVKEIEEWDNMIASVMGKLKDTGAQVVGPILNRPDFEHLEAQGNPKSYDLSPLIAKLKEIEDGEIE